MEWIVIALAAAGLVGLAIAWLVLPKDHWIVRLVDFWQPNSHGVSEDYTRQDLDRDRKGR